MNRLVGFWRQSTTRGRTLLVVAPVVAVVSVVAVFAVSRAANHPDEAANVAPQPAGTTDGTKTSKPVRCLDAAGLSGVEEQDGDLWRGLPDGSAYAIVVHKLATRAKAPTVVAGTYALTGRFKVAAEGTGLTSEEGLEADALVQVVADCLGD